MLLFFTTPEACCYAKQHESKITTKRNDVKTLVNDFMQEVEAINEHRNN